MIVACSQCATRFSGDAYRDAHCPACGALAQLASERPCPRCELPLEAREIGDVVVDECSKCQGLFLDHVAIERVIHDRERAETILTTLPRHPISAMPAGKMYVRCPCCSTVMNRKLFATGSGVIVDVCRADGMFFDAGELPAIIDFVMQGGLERAAKRDAERKQEEARRVRLQKLREDEKPHTVHGDRANALIEFLWSLFD